MEAINKAVSIRLRRCREGIEMTVKVQEDIEAFFRQWGGGEQVPPSHGRLWKPSAVGQEVLVWSFDGYNIDLSHERYSLLGVGSALFDDNGRINISFIRLVGASQPGGVRIILESVIGTDALNKIANQICTAAQSFYMNFIQQVNLEIYVGVLDRTNQNA